MKRGDVYWVELDPSIGSETKKTRPCLIISKTELNGFSPVVIVAPITSNIKKVYWPETLLHLGKVMLQQSRAIDKSRIKDFIESISEVEQMSVDAKLKFVFNLK